MVIMMTTGDGVIIVIASYNILMYRIYGNLYLVINMPSLGAFLPAKNAFKQQSVLSPRAQRLKPLLRWKFEYFVVLILRGVPQAPIVLRPAYCKSMFFKIIYILNF